MDGRCGEDGAHEQRPLHALPARKAQHDRHGRGDRIAPFAGDPRGREPRDRGPGGTQTTAGGSELMERITVVKIGGNVIDNPAAMKRFLKEFAALEGPKILVHGGACQKSVH